MEADLFDFPTVSSPTEPSHLSNSTPGIVQEPWPTQSIPENRDFEFQLKLPSEDTDPVTLNGKKTSNSVQFEFQNSTHPDYIDQVIEQTLKRLYEREKKQSESLWVLGALYKLPPIPGACPTIMDNVQDMKAIRMDLTTSVKSQNSLRAYECEKIVEKDVKSVSFFGTHNHVHTKSRKIIASSECRRMIRLNKSPAGDPLHVIIWDKNGTTLVAEAEYYWPKEHEISVTNYYVNTYELSVNPVSGVVFIPGVNFIQP